MNATHAPVVAFALLLTSSAMAAEAPAGAASCTGCHTTSAKVTTPIPRITGRDPGEIVAAMAAFRSGARPATVMDRIAKGYSDEEVRAIAAWLGTQR